MIRPLTVGTLVFSLCTIALSQATVQPKFEVASVKRSDPDAKGPLRGIIQGGPGTADPERITANSVTLQRLIREAYGVEFDQIQGPSWMTEEKYDITARVPSKATKYDLKLMLQDLLQDRFGLAFHRISKDFPIYELTIAKGGVEAQGEHRRS